VGNLASRVAGPPSNHRFHLTAAPVDLAETNLIDAQPQVNPDR
jgi:hypothetical protein